MTLKWKRWGAEYMAFTYVRGVGSKERYARDPLVVGWRAYRSALGEWSLGVDVGTTGTHVVVARARTLYELKGMAAGVVSGLYHELDP